MSDKTSKQHLLHDGSLMLFSLMVCLALLRRKMMGMKMYSSYRGVAKKGRKVDGCGAECFAETRELGGEPVENSHIQLRYGLR